MYIYVHTDHNMHILIHYVYVYMHNLCVYVEM
jgi:hypothetical protein